MNQGIRTIIYPVEDIARAKALYSKLLGVEPCVENPYYVGFNVGDQHVGLDPKGHRTGPLAYWHVSDVKESLQLVLDAGGQMQQAVKDVGGGKLVAAAKDTEGNLVGFIQTP